MPERDSFPVGSDTERLFDLDDARLYNAAGLTPTSVRAARGGFRPAGGALDPGAVFASGTADTFVHVTSFVYWLPSTRGQGTYTLLTDGQTDLDVLGVDPADSTLGRHDLIIAHQADAYFGDPDSKMRIRRIKGEPSASPQDPPTTAYPDHVKLARVRVNAGAETITPADIDDLRPSDRFTVALGGILPVANVAERNAIVNPYEGMHIYRRDKDWTEVYDGGGWRVQGIAVCSGAPDRDSAITNPYNGQLAYTTDSNKLWHRRAGTWTLFPNTPLAHFRQTAPQTLTSSVFASLAFAGEDHDTHAGHDNVVNNSRYTCVIPGVYELTGGVAFSAHGEGVRICQWAKNGVVIDGSDMCLAPPSIGAAARIPARTIHVTLAAGDYVQLQAMQDGAPTLDTYAAAHVRSTMTVKYVGG